MTSYTREFLDRYEKDRAEVFSSAFAVPKLDREDRLQLIYLGLMLGQSKGIATEHTLIDCARFWWYDDGQYEISPTYF